MGNEKPKGPSNPVVVLNNPDWLLGDGADGLGQYDPWHWKSEIWIEPLQDQDTGELTFDTDLG